MISGVIQSWQRKEFGDLNIEPLVVGCQPYYLTREFSHVIVLVYIPPLGNGKLAAETISCVTHDL